MHKIRERDFPAKNKLRKIEIKELKFQLAAQQSVFTRPNTRRQAAAITSYRVSQVLVKQNAFQRW